LGVTKFIGSHKGSRTTKRGEGQFLPEPKRATRDFIKGVQKGANESRKKSLQPKTTEQGLCVQECGFSVVCVSQKCGFLLVAKATSFSTQYISRSIILNKEVYLSTKI